MPDSFSVPPIILHPSEYVARELAKLAQSPLLVEAPRKAIPRRRAVLWDREDEPIRGDRSA